MPTILTIILSAFGVFSVSRVCKVLGYLRSLKGIPHSFILFHPFDFPGIIIPTSWWNAGADYGWKNRLHFKEKYGENVVLIPLLQGGPAFVTCNLEVTRQFNGTSAGTAFGKLKMVGPLGYWSPNLFTSEGDDWKRHKRVLIPAFNSQLYNHVWDESIKTYHRLILKNGWNDLDQVRINRVQDFTYKFAMLIIGKCGFGFDWTDSLPSTDSSNNITLENALHIIIDGAMFLGLVPDFVLKMPFQNIKNTIRVAEEFTDFMKASAKEKHDELANDEGRVDDHRKDIFTLLVKANSEESGKNKLSDKELIGNVFLMLFAGHETTASVLAVCFAYLAAYPNIQEETFRQVKDVFGSEKEPDFECFSKLDKVQSVFFESLRLYPPGYAIARDAVNDAVLKIPAMDDPEQITPMSIPKGTRVISDMVGIQYNSRYFHDPTEFIPSRWKGGDNEPELLLSAFSVGPRTCIGRKFAIVEAVSVLAVFLRDWRIEPLLQERETTGTWCNRVLQANVTVTLTIHNVPVVLIKRKW